MKEQDWSLVHSQNSMDLTTYRFICEKHVPFGKALYIVGNIEQLGEWNLNCAIRLDCYLEKYWVIDIDIPVDTEIQYKFFVESFEHHFDRKLQTIPDKSWVGNQENSNFKLLLFKRDASHIQQSRKSKQLKVMSFNVRYENNFDSDDLHWQNRKQNCLELIFQKFPSIIGVQEARNSQRKYLCESLTHLYNYVGVARDLKQGEEVGIFYDKQRFVVVDYGFKWMSETQKPGSFGFGARFQRYFTYIILEDTYTSEKFQRIFSNKVQEIQTWIPRNLILVENVHLDHQSKLAQQKGIEIMAKQIQMKISEYKDAIKDIFVCGDFNTHEQNPIFSKFKELKPSLESIRRYFSKKNLNDLCDYNNTFNGFNKGNNDIECRELTIDHLWIWNNVYKPIKFQAIRKLVHIPKKGQYCIVSDHFPIMGTFKVNSVDF